MVRYGKYGIIPLALLLCFAWSCGRKTKEKATVQVTHEPTALVPQATPPELPPVPESTSDVTEESPTSKVPVANVKRLTAGEKHTCALVADGTVVCWGRNRFLELGVKDLKHRPKPEPVVLSRGAIWVAANATRTCAVENDGDLICWGKSAGLQPSLPTKQRSTKPVRKVWVSATGSVCALFGDNSHCVSAASGGDDSRLVAKGRRHTCLLFKNGTVTCKGDNAVGQLGVPNIQESRKYVPVQGLPKGVVQLSAGNNHTCALTRKGKVYCWGSDDHGQLGTPQPKKGNARSKRRTRAKKDPVFSAQAKMVPELPKAVDILARYHHTCAVLKGGKVKCWGRSRYGVLGPKDALGEVAGVTDAMEVAMGRTHTCALTTTGAVYCWGLNDDGQCGHAKSIRVKAPQQVIIPPRTPTE